MQSGLRNTLLSKGIAISFGPKIEFSCPAGFGSRSVWDDLVFFTLAVESRLVIARYYLLFVTILTSIFSGTARAEVAVKIGQNFTGATFGVDSYPSAVLYSTRAWQDAHPESTRSLARAILRTLEWMRAHSPEEIRARMPASFRTDDPATDHDGLRSLQNMLSPDGRITPESAAAVHQVLSVSLEGVRAKAIDVRATYTDQFLK